MDLPEWDPVVALATAQSLSGPIPARVALHIQCDQAVSHMRLAPSPAARMPVPPGHGLEIQTALWSATRARGPSSGSNASIPMGARCGPDLTPNPRAPGHAAERRAAGTVTREPDEEKNLLWCGVYRLDTGLLMGAPQTTRRQSSSASRRIPSGNDCRAGPDAPPAASGDPSTRPFRLRALHFAATSRLWLRRDESGRGSGGGRGSCPRTRTQIVGAHRGQAPVVYCAQRHKSPTRRELGREASSISGFGENPVEGAGLPEGGVSSCRVSEKADRGGNRLRVVNRQWKRRTNRITNWRLHGCGVRPASAGSSGACRRRRALRIRAPAPPAQQR
jgi:hypothetical protein